MEVLHSGGDLITRSAIALFRNDGMAEIQTRHYSFLEGGPSERHLRSVHTKDLGSEEGKESFALVWGEYKELIARSRRVFVVESSGEITFGKDPSWRHKESGNVSHLS